MVLKLILAALASLPGSAAESEEDSDWRVAAGSISGERAIVRYLSELPAMDFRSQYTWLTEITWDYDADDEGMPNPQSQQRLSRFEETNQNKLEQVGLSILVAVTTGNGRREYLYYIAERESFIEAFNRAFETQPKMPIQINFYEDPEWSELLRIHSRVES